MSEEATQELQEIAGKLSKGAAKACARMSDQWQFAGKDTFNANGAWALHWAKGVGGKGAVAEYETRKDGKWVRPAYRLTPLGLALRNHLLEKGPAHDR